ncbi:PucR family transcriptional regulator [Actinokineospora guangxiensis]|uniref:PucR family transcriptional regulator n=1 Tax=Actinokineospora guangxiensis TaxID=1490288 RepID=A0ABW0ESC3_9PSEU
MSASPASGATRGVLSTLLDHPLPRGPRRLVGAGLLDLIEVVKGEALGAPRCDSTIRLIASRTAEARVSPLDLVEAADRWCASAIAATWDCAVPDTFASVSTAVDALAAKHLDVNEAYAAAWFAAPSGSPLTVVAKAVLNAHNVELVTSAAGVRLPKGDVAVAAVRLEAPVAPGMDDTRALWCMDAGELVIIVSAAGHADATAEQARDLLARLRVRPRGAVVTVTGPLGEARSAVTRSRRLRGLAHGLPPAVYDEHQLLVDAAVSTDPAASEGLAALLDPLLEQPELLRTLRAVYAADLHRGAAAEALGVHRQTVAHRIGRIAQITGVDPLSTRGVLLLSTGLAVTADTAVER